MYSEADLLPLSGLQHMSFCERRWALIQIEGVWADNRFTAEGSVLHERAHSGEIESRPGVLVRRTLPVRSFALGLSGQADIVEFEPSATASGLAMPRRKGLWTPFPVEYKRSRDKSGSIAYKVQLCAQALCLEEMLNCDVPAGAVFDGQTRRREPVPFDAALRTIVKDLAAKMQALFGRGVTPPPVFKRACRNCSLVELCRPEALSKNQSVSTYIRRILSSPPAL